MVEAWHKGEERQGMEKLHKLKQNKVMTRFSSCHQGRIRMSKRQKVFLCSVMVNTECQVD